MLAQSFNLKILLLKKYIQFDCRPLDCAADSLVIFGIFTNLITFKGGKKSIKLDHLVGGV